MTALCLEARFAATVGYGDGGFDLDVTLHLERGTLVLFGPSGAGKTLTIRGLAGLLRPTAGHISLGDNVLFESASGRWVPPHLRRVGYVPQSPSLMPQLNVAQNVAFGLPRSKRRPDDPTVLQLLEATGTRHLAEASVGRLSGGEVQRVSLARALSNEPELLLLDEPFASLDEGSRANLGELVKELSRAQNVPVVLVTHDRAEAQRIGDSVVLFETGRTTEQGPVSLLG